MYSCIIRKQFDSQFIVYSLLFIKNVHTIGEQSLQIVVNNNVKPYIRNDKSQFSIRIDLQNYVD